MEAENSAEALEVLTNNKGKKVDLLFTDIAMPGDMNGVQLAARVSVIYPDIKILFTSGYSEQSIPDFNLIKEGQLISKPYDDNDLLIRVRKMLSP